MYVVDVALCLDAYALLAARAGEVAPAARFLGAAAAVINEAGVDWDHLGSVAYGYRQRSSLRSRLGGAAFDRCYREGASWPIQAASAEALAFTPAVLKGGQHGLRMHHPRLTLREVEVLRHMATGLSNQQIADALLVSVRTITTHMTNILDKLGVESRTAVVAFAIRQGMV